MAAALTLLLNDKIVLGRQWLVDMVPRKNCMITIIFRFQITTDFENWSVVCDSGKVLKCDYSCIETRDCVWCAEFLSQEIKLPSLYHIIIVAIMPLKNAFRLIFMSIFMLFSLHVLPKLPCCVSVFVLPTTLCFVFVSLTPPVFFHPVSVFLSSLLVSYIVFLLAVAWCFWCFL